MLEPLLRFSWRQLIGRSGDAPTRRSGMVRVLHDEPKFSEMFVSYLLARSARAEED
jgi:hypothetical protein